MGWAKSDGGIVCLLLLSAGKKCEVLFTIVQVSAADSAWKNMTTYLPLCIGFSQELCLCVKELLTE